MMPLLGLAPLPVQASIPDLPPRGAAYSALASPDGFAFSLGIPDLRSARLMRSDVEVRVWRMAGSSVPFAGLWLVRRSGVSWGRSLEPVLTGGSPAARGWRALPAPSSGWASFWVRAEVGGLLSLPDESALPGVGQRENIADGLTILVEAATAGRYRFYSYYTPEENPQWPEAERMVALLAFLDREFPKRRFR